MTKEQKFYKALQDVFIGAKIEGESGNKINYLTKVLGTILQICDYLFSISNILHRCGALPLIIMSLFQKENIHSTRYRIKKGGCYGKFIE